MRTDRTSCRILLAVLLAGVTGNANAWEADWDLDMEMAVLESPMRRPIILPYGDGRQRGSPPPGWSYYKQQPPAAQGDFRAPLPGGGATGPGSAPGEAAPTGGSPGGSGGAPGPVAGGGSGGGGSGGGGSNGNDGKPPSGPQLPVPDMGGPDIPTDPLPLPPPGPF